jgi:hypothetical protein
MGACSSSTSPRRNLVPAAAGSRSSAIKLIPDRYNSYEEVSAALRAAGLEQSQLIVGVDLTGSNMQTGKRSFGGRCLHDVSDPDSPNPYCQALTVVAKALWDFDDDHMIPAYGFGDSHTGAQTVFSFQANDKPCKGLVSCLQRYQEIVKKANLWGPTSFAPLIRQAIKLVRETNEYHILVIVADGQVSKGSCMKETIDAIVEASHYALSIVMVGVGDGPWTTMETFDDELPERRFDNFQFVDFAGVFNKYPKEKRELAFATHALMEVPDQYRTVQELGLLNPGRRLPRFPEPAAPLPPPDAPARPEDPWHGLPAGWDAVLEQNKVWTYRNFVTKETSQKKPAAAPNGAVPARTNIQDDLSTSTGSSSRSGGRFSRC